MNISGTKTEFAGKHITVHRVGKTGCEVQGVGWGLGGVGREIISEKLSGYLLKITVWSGDSKWCCEETNETFYNCSAGELSYDHGGFIR